GQETLTLRRSTSIKENVALMSVAFSGDGRRLASASIYETVVWDAGTGQDTLNLRGHNIGQVRWVVFSPDGRRLASAGSDQTVRLWDTDRGQETFSLRGHTHEVTSLAFSPDGRRLASAAG